MFISTIFFVVMYSLITRTFPPDFSRLGKTYDRFKDFQKSTAEYKPSTSQNSSEEDDIDHLTELYDKRAAMASELLGGSMTSLRGHEPSPSPLKSSSASSVREGKSNEIEILKAHVLTLEDRLDDLENELQELRFKHNQLLQRIPASQNL